MIMGHPLDDIDPEEFKIRLARRASHEESLVRHVGGAIGYGRTMQLCEQLWEEALKKQGLSGGSHSVGCCVSFLVPCPGQTHKQGNGHKCDWCCGAGRVTQKVAWAMSRLEPST